MSLYAFILRQLAQGVLALLLVLLLGFWVLYGLGGLEGFGIASDGGFLRLFARYVHHLLTFQWGSSLEHQVGVFGLVWRHGLITAEFFVIAMVIGSVGGVAIGTYITLRQASWLAKLLHLLTNFFFAVPVFWWAMLAIYWSNRLLLDFLGLEGGSLDLAEGYIQNSWVMQHQIWIENFFTDRLLPLLLVCLLPMAMVAYQIRFVLGQAMRSRHVGMARARGLGAKRILVDYVLRNTLISPSMSPIYWVGSLLSGVMVMELMLGWAGIGQLMLKAFQAQDVLLLHGAFLAMLFVVVGISFVIQTLVRLFRFHLQSDENQLSERPILFHTNQLTRRLSHFWQLPLAKAATISILITLVVALFAPWIAPYQSGSIDFSKAYAMPVWAGKSASSFLLGSNPLGEDLLSLVLYGFRYAWGFCLVALSLSMVVSLALAIFGVQYEKLSSLLGRLGGLTFAFPGLLMAVAVASISKASALTLIVALALFHLPLFVRVLMHELQLICARPYIQNIRFAGLGTWQILLTAALPRLWPVVALQSLLTLPALMVEFTTLSFLGFGGDTSAWDWGSQLWRLEDYTSDNWWLLVLPGLALVWLVMSLQHVARSFGSVVSQTLE